MGQPIAGSNPALSASPAGYAVPMPRQPRAVDLALRRMLDAEDRKDGTGAGADWNEWQRAATDYWLLLHPELAPHRRGDPARTPTVAELRERAGLVSRAMHGIPSNWRLQPRSAERSERLARVGWFHELGLGLYEPVFDAIARAPRDRAAVETLIRF